jgi:hypothetical protein
MTPNTSTVEARLKRCPKCELTLSLDKFPKNSQTKDGFHCYCKPCKKDYSLTWYHANPDKAKNSRLKGTFGITLGDYDNLLKAQNGCCAICQTNTPTGIGGFHVDHCHKTNKIRGLLCSKCNHALGLFNDNQTNLRKAIEYLNRAENKGRL